MEARHNSLPMLANGSHDTAIDPVCGMTVDKATAKHTLEHNSARYYFCCRSCRDKFAANPAAFLSGPPEQRRVAGHDHSKVAAAPALDDSLPLPK
jgi:Cu+-exporting ATPase